MYECAVHAFDIFRIFLCDYLIKHLMNNVYMLVKVKIEATDIIVAKYSTAISK